MQMPSLFKYFVTVGSALMGVLFLANYLLEQPAPATAQNATAPKSVVVKTDPQASRVERWRAEQAAADAARKEEAVRLAAQPAEPETAVAQPVKAAATPAASTVAHGADTSLATDASAADQAKLKSRKVRAAEKARTKRLAREDARPANTRTASNQQDDYYYGQRQGYAQQGYAQRPMFGPAPAYAYAPQQSFGPFGGGWGGRGW